jgi:hypothetical protein
MAGDSIVPDNEDLTRAIEDALARVIGRDPASWVAGAINKGFGEAMASQINVPGMGALNMPFHNLPFGSPTNVGANAAAAFDQSAIEAIMRPTFNSLRELQFQQRSDMQRFFDDKLTKGEAEAKAGQAFNGANFVSNLLFNQYKPMELQAGLEEGARYLGGGASFGVGGGEQARLNRSISELTQAIATDFVNSPEAYNGLNGRQTGQLFAEMARTGALATSAGGGGADAESVIGTVRQASETISQLQRLFKGTIPQLLDQVNTLFGADFQQTFGDGASAMLSNISNVGLASGFSSTNMTRLMMGANQITQSMGGETTGVGAVAMQAATIMRSGLMNSGENPMAWVTEPGLRATILRNTASAQNSSVNRLISGGVALIRAQAGADEEDVNAFVSSLEGRTLSSRVITDELRSRGFAGLTESRLRNMGETPEARLARDAGIGLEATQLSRANILNRNRQLMLRQSMSLSDAQENAIVRRAMGMGGMTLNNIEQALDASGISATESLNIRGAMMSRLENSSEAREGGVGAADLFLEGMGNPESRRLMRERGETMSRFDKRFEGRGPVSGFLRVKELLKLDKDDKDLKSVLNVMLGKTKADVSDDEIQDFFGFRSELAGLGTSSDDVFVKLGVASAFEAATIGRIGDKLATKEQQELGRKLMSNPFDKDAFIKFGKGNTPGIFEARVQSRIESANAGMGEGNKISKSQEMDIRRQVRLETILEESRGGTLESSGADSPFDTNLTMMTAEMGAGSTYEEAIQEVFGDNKQRQREFESRVNSEGRLNERVPATIKGERTGLEAVSRTLDRILAWLQDLEINKL